MKQLDESMYIRHRMYNQKKAKWRQYAELVIGQDAGLGTLIDYEIRTGLLKSLPGAVGLVARSKLFRKLFRSVGKNVIIGSNVTIRNGKNISLGDNVVIDDGCVMDGRGAVEDGLVIGSNTIVGRDAIIHSKIGDIHIGSNCNIGTGVIITSQGGVEIGDRAQIAGGCKISGGRFKLDPDIEDGTPLRRYSNGPIRIGEGCFLGGGAHVTDGVHIGQFSVVGTGAIVMDNIPEYSVYMPRPGMIIGTTKDMRPMQHNE